jgi:hypothetical protein
LPKARSGVDLAFVGPYGLVGGSTEVLKLVPTTPTIGRLGCSTGGRASEAVDDNIGVARDNETTAGTDDDLVAGLVLPARHSSFGDESDTATGTDALFASRDLADGTGFSDRVAGRSVMNGSLMRFAITGLGSQSGQLASAMSHQLTCLLRALMAHLLTLLLLLLPKTLQ